MWALSFLRRWSTPDEYAHFCRLPPAEAAEMLHGLAAKGEFTTCEIAGVVRYGRVHKAGLLLWEPRLADIAEFTKDEIEEQVPVVTPFAVEFAGADVWHAGAPRLVPVPDAAGTPVAGTVLILDFRRDGGDAHDTLHQFTTRWDISPTSPAAYAAYKLADEARTKRVEHAVLENFAGVRHVVYFRAAADIQSVLDTHLPPLDKGLLLAELAAFSLTAETYAQGTDGIQYLLDAIALGIETPLLPFYRDALLRLADGAPDLAAARLHLAQRKGLA